jgi:gas vesicle protein
MDAMKGEEDVMMGEEGYTVVGTEHYTAAGEHGRASTVLFFLLGAALGAGLGLLLTPQSGSQTRRQIKEVTKDTKEKVTSCYTQVAEKVGATLDKGKEIVKEGTPLLTAAIEAGKEAYARAKEERAGHTT